MPEEAPWIGRARDQVREYINTTYTMQPNPELPPVFEINVIWDQELAAKKEVLFRTTIGDDLRYLVTVTGEGSSERIAIEPIDDGPMEV